MDGVGCPPGVLTLWYRTPVPAARYAEQTGLLAHAHAIDPMWPWTCAQIAIGWELGTGWAS